MSKASLDIAKSYLKKRNFSYAITVLESCEELYEGDFEYYLTFGIACLYIGQIGRASSYFNKARTIKINSVPLLLGQAAIFFRRGQTDRAIQYYLDVLDLDPNNSIAKSALDFLRVTKDYSEICNICDNGKIEKFYPDLGVNPNIVIFSVLAGVFVGTVIFCLVYFIPGARNRFLVNGPRANLEGYMLSVDEKHNARENNLSDVVIKYTLSNSQVNSTYSNLLSHFQNHRDNACMVEINKLLNSNASASIKKKAVSLTNYFEEITFDTLPSIDNFNLTKVSQDPFLYKGCTVAWQGRISDLKQNEDGWSCILLVGYENQVSLEGLVEVVFDKNYLDLVKTLEPAKPVRFLGKIDIVDSKLILRGKAVYQPMNGKL